MSRAERRAYKRMMKNQDPYALPGGDRVQRARAARQRNRGQGRPAAGELPFVTRRFLLWALGGGALVGLFAFSVAWPSGMPFALYVGLAGAAGWVGLAALFRVAQRRATRPRR
jgi:hypothetical protein